MQKVIFIDVDGTLVNDHGVIPESAKLAIRKARDNTLFLYVQGAQKLNFFPKY